MRVKTTKTQRRAQAIKEAKRSALAISKGHERIMSDYFRDWRDVVDLLVRWGKESFDALDVEFDDEGKPRNAKTETNEN